MGIKKYAERSSAEYTVTYSGMRGVAFDRADGGDKRYRFSYLENMYKDYSGGAGAIESLPGYRRIACIGKRINGLYPQRSADGSRHLIAHGGDGIYRIDIGENDDAEYVPSRIATVRDARSAAFGSGHDVFILDGERMVRITSDGESHTVGEDDEALPYVPTTFVNGQEHEQRNLLTDLFTERYLIASAKDSAASTEGLRFAILSEEDGTATVTGIEDSVAGYVYIPSYALIDGREYVVTEIASDAFRANLNITSLILPDTLLKIGDRAFMSASRLKEVITRDSLTHIGELAFAACRALDTLYLGAGLAFVGMDCFSICPSLKVIHYAKDTDSFLNIDGYQDFSGFTVNCFSYADKIRVEIPIFSPAEEILYVKLGEETVTEYEIKMKDGLVNAVLLDRDYASELDGKEIVLGGIAASAKFTSHSVGYDFIEENGAAIRGYDAIMGCTVAECFDGRVFLSGNPALPNTVFYSSRDSTGKNNPLYFGVLNYFNDGVGGFGIGSLLAAGDSLAVFKTGDDGGGSIYYHTPKETGLDMLPKIYPVSYIHSGIYAKGPSISFYDDPIFISGLGVTALDKRAINLERSISVRSSNINPRLLGEDLERIRLAKWCGYLAVLCEDRIYLADSRATFISDKGNTEYEWYYATDIASYVGDTPVYRFSEARIDGIDNYPKPHGRVTTPVVTEEHNGETVYVTYVDGTKYLVYKTEQREGGIPSPATELASYEDTHLFFGTESGDVFLFNNDKRGIAPPHVSAQPDFDGEEYKRIYGRTLHPSYYSHAGHAPTYAVKTVDDDGGIPNLTKSTVKGSLTVKFRSRSNSRVRIEVGTEREGFTEVADIRSPSFDFGDMDFEGLSFSNDDTLTLVIKDGSKKWVRKSVTVYSDDYASPFALESLIYRFRIKGKIKY